MADLGAEVEALKGLVATQSVLIDELALALARIAPDEMESRIMFLEAVLTNGGPRKGPLQTSTHFRAAVEHLREQMQSQLEADADRPPSLER